MPTFNQSKPDDEGEPVARQVTADEREILLQTAAQLGLPPETVDAYVAGGKFTGVDDAVKHFRALAGAAPSQMGAVFALVDAVEARVRNEIQASAADTEPEPPAAAPPAALSIVMHQYMLSYEDGRALVLLAHNPEALRQNILTAIGSKQDWLTMEAVAASGQAPVLLCIKGLTGFHPVPPDEFMKVTVRAPIGGISVLKRIAAPVATYGGVQIANHTGGVTVSGKPKPEAAAGA